MADEQKVTVDGKEYNLADLSGATKNQMMALRACEAEINRLQMQMNIVQTARQTYAATVKKALDDVNGE